MKGIRLICLLAIFALLLPLAFAADEGIKPKKTGYARATVNLSWNIDLQGQELSELQIKTFEFGNYPSQQRLYETTSIPAYTETNAFKNGVLVFDLDPKKDFQGFSMQTELKVQFGFDFAKATDASNYLKESAYIKITPEIKQKASQIASNYKTDMEKAVAIAQWVHNNVKYDRNYINVVKGSDAVMSERAGTCDEFSHLFIAMLRSIGIPAKFAASYVYSGTDWGAHAFVEAAIDGEWIPFDPTFNEGIILDATHLKFGEGFDQADIKEDISIRSYNADVSKVKLTRDFDVKFNEVRNFPELFTLQLILPESEVGQGSIEAIKARVSNKGNRLAVPLSLLLPPEVKISGENLVNEDKLVLLEPYEEKEVEWKVIIPKLESGYEYKFPVLIESLGQDATGTIRASDEGDVQKNEELKITGISSAKTGSGIQIAVTVKNTGNIEAAGSISMESQNHQSQSQPVALGAGLERQFIFSLVPLEGEETLRGEFGLETTGKKTIQPFEFSLMASIQPPIWAPSSSISATQGTGEGNQFANIPGDYAVMLGGMILIIALFFLAKWIL
ncbi:MAG: transglutaminase-like domain-containing protein [Candidatus Micrarchaeota archaeon]